MTGKGDLEKRVIEVGKIHVARELKVARKNTADIANAFLLNFLSKNCTFNFRRVQQLCLGLNCGSALYSPGVLKNETTAAKSRKIYNSSCTYVQINQLLQRHFTTLRLCYHALNGMQSD